MTNSHRRSTAFTLPLKPILTTRARGDKLVCSSNDAAALSSRGGGFVSGGLPIHNAAPSLMNVTKAIAEQPTNTSNASTTKKSIKKFTWGYVDDIGPDKWAQINEEWAICDTGKKQSPIGLSYKASRIASPSELRPSISIDGGGSRAKFSLFHKEAAAFSITKWLVVEPRIAPTPPFLGTNPPFTILSEKSPIVLSLPNVGTYRLKNIHFHTGGSEHVLNEKPAAMEAHFVFALDQPAADPTSITDNLTPRGYGSSHCVVGVMINEGTTTSPWLNSIFTNAIKPLNKDIEEKGALVELDMNQVLPNFNNSNIFTYDGSLTTPPGAEGIHWIVMNERASVSTQDWDLLETFQGGPNTRPLQKSNGREVVQFPVVVSES